LMTWQAISAGPYLQVKKSSNDFIQADYGLPFKLQ